MNKTDTAHAAQNEKFNLNPLFGSDELKLETTRKAVTPFAGKASFFVWLGVLEFSKRVAAVMPFEYRSPNAIAPEQTLMAFISAVAVGASRFAHALVIFEGHFKRNYIHIRDVARVFLHGLENFETMCGRAYNVSLEDANLTKLELCAVIQKHLPKFVYLEAPIGEDPDKSDYIVSNQRILSTGWKPAHSLDDGIRELIKGYRILKNSTYANV